MKFYSLIAIIAFVGAHKISQKSVLKMRLEDEPDSDRVSFFAQKLGIEMTPELMQLGSNEAISQALVEMAVGMGKSEEEIGAALDTVQGA